MKKEEKLLANLTQLSKRFRRCRGCTGIDLVPEISNLLVALAKARGVTMDDKEMLDTGRKMFNLNRVGMTECVPFIAAAH
jgi:hypothetical protein